MKIIVLIIAAFITIVKVNAQTFQQSYTYSTTVIRAFHQGHEGDFNCASIALIKCAIATFGSDNVFKAVTKENDVYKITLRNGETVILSKQELDTATARNGFKLDDNQNMLNQANLIYAVMAKRAVTFCISNTTFGLCTNLDSALMFLHGETGGVDARRLPILLGLARVKVRHKKELSYIYENGYHAVFASKKVWDNYGSPDRLSLRYWRIHIEPNPIKDLESINFKLVDLSDLK